MIVDGTLALNIFIINVVNVTLLSLFYKIHRGAKQEASENENEVVPIYKRTWFFVVLSLVMYAVSVLIEQSFSVLKRNNTEDYYAFQCTSVKYAVSSGILLTNVCFIISLILGKGYSWFLMPAFFFTLFSIALCGLSRSC